MATQLQVLF